MLNDVFLPVLTRNRNSKPNPNPIYPNSNPNAKPNPGIVTRQFLGIEGDDSEAHGELTAAVIESELRTSSPWSSRTWRESRETHPLKPNSSISHTSTTDGKCAFSKTLWKDFRKNLGKYVQALTLSYKRKLRNDSDIFTKVRHFDTRICDVIYYLLIYLVKSAMSK